MRLYLLLTFTICITQTSPALPALAKTQAAMVKPTNSCDFIVMSSERDPAGLNIRSGPGTSHSVVGKVPAIMESEGGLTAVAGPQFQVLGSTQGWLYVQSLGEDAELTGKPERPMYKGKGWVSGKKVFANIQSTKGFEKPSAKSKLVINQNDPAWAGYSVADQHVLQCSGVWAQFQTFYRETGEDYKPLPNGKTRTVTAWFRGLCSIFETSCDGLESDY